MAPDRKPRLCSCAGASESECVTGVAACVPRSFHRRTAGIWYHARPSDEEESSLAEESSGGVAERQVEDEAEESVREWCADDMTVEKAKASAGKGVIKEGCQAGSGPFMLSVARHHGHRPHSSSGDQHNRMAWPRLDISKRHLSITLHCLAAPTNLLFPLTTKQQRFHPEWCPEQYTTGVPKRGYSPGHKSVTSRHSDGPSRGDLHFYMLSAAVA